NLVRAPFAPLLDAVGPHVTTPFDLACRLFAAPVDLPGPLLIALSRGLPGKRITALLDTGGAPFGAAIDPLGALLAALLDPLGAKLGARVGALGLTRVALLRGCD